MSDLSHLRLENTAQPVPYTFAGGGGGGEFRTPPRDRLPHAQKLRSDLQQAEADAKERRRQHGVPEDAGPGDVIAVRSDRDFQLKLDSLERHQSGIDLLSVKVEDGVTVANVFVPRGKHARLLAIIDAYEKHSTSKGQPRNRELVESIASITLAALRDLWQDTVPFPAQDATLWWEVWLRNEGQTPADVHRRFAELAQAAGMRASEQFVQFPERVVVQAFGSQEQLGQSLDLLAMIAELRQAKELATEYVELAPADQRAYVDEAVGRIVPPPADAPTVCILDSGVNREHPLLAPTLAAVDAHSVKPEEWGTADDRYQHGTEMAGIALYGPLTDLFTSSGPVQLRHRLESVKILPPPPGHNDPKDYAPFTIQAVARAEIQAPQRNRAICMAVTADDRDLGMPSLWSGAVDQICFGEEDGDQRLMFLAAGNLREEITRPEYEYHRWNCERGGIEDPAQAWNALTVGACTDRVFIQQEDYLGWQPVASAGDLSPASRTSLPWPAESQTHWPIKPDIVLEGGNYAQSGTNREGCDDLSLLTTVFPPPPLRGRLLDTTRDTSPATGLASRLGAIIWSHYPRFWPETVRGLMVHSARWTPRMRQRFPGDTKASIQRRLRCYGYGVPQLQAALWSAENAATLIFEGRLQPYRKDGSDIRSNEMHLHNLPWPVAVLQDLGETPVTMRVTLSYFIEPSPGRVGWTRKHRYQSHGLRFDVNRPTEDEQAFRQRLSREEWEDDKRPDSVAETRNWAIGDQGRRKGSSGQEDEEAAMAEVTDVRPTGLFPPRPRPAGQVQAIAECQFLVHRRRVLLVGNEPDGVEPVALRDTAHRQLLHESFDRRDVPVCHSLFPPDVVMRPHHRDVASCHLEGVGLFLGTIP